MEEPAWGGRAGLGRRQQRLGQGHQEARPEHRRNTLSPSFLSAALRAELEPATCNDGAFWKDVL